jgi:hypothetical protein
LGAAPAIGNRGPSEGLSLLENLRVPVLLQIVAHIEAAERWNVVGEIGPFPHTTELAEYSG